MAKWYSKYVQDGKFTKDDARSALESGISTSKVGKFIKNNPDKLKKNNKVQSFLDNYVNKNKNQGRDPSWPSPQIGPIPPSNAFDGGPPLSSPYKEPGRDPSWPSPQIGPIPPSDAFDRPVGIPSINTPGGFTPPGAPIDLREPFVPETPDGQFPGYQPPGTRPEETTVGDATDDLGAGPTPGAGGDPPETIGLTREELEEVISGMLNPILENMPDYQNTADFDYNPNNLFEYTYKDEDGNIVTESMTIDTIEHLQDLDLQKQKNIGAERLKIIESGINDRLAASTDYGNLMSFSGVTYTSDMQSGIRKYEADVASGVNIYRANLEAATASGVQKLKNQGAVDLQSIVNSGLAAVETIRGGYTVSGIGLQTQASETIARIQAQADKYRARRGVEGQIYGGLVAGFWS